MTFVILCEKHRIESLEKYGDMSVEQILEKTCTEPVEERTDCSNPPCRLASRIDMGNGSEDRWENEGGHISDRD